MSRRRSHRYLHVPLIDDWEPGLHGGFPNGPYATVQLLDREFVVSNDGYWQELPLKNGRNFWYHLESMWEILFDVSVNGLP